jgi:CubicO group peptidase (beta-lactamase class C family)
MLRLVTFLTLGLCATQALAQSPMPVGEAPNAVVSELINQRMIKAHIPGAQVAVVRRGRVEMLESYGLANIEHQAAATDESVFALNSITKVFTAVAILQLAEDGRLSIDDPISRHIDNLPVAWRTVTVRQLLNHTSGLPNIIDDHERIIGGGDAASAWDLVQTLPIEFRSGDRYSYNQTGYVILGKIIDKLAGEPFTTFIETRQFQAAGMKHTQFGDSSDIIANSAGSYTTIENVNGRWVDRGRLAAAFVEFPVFFRTAAGALSTAEDMARWMIALQSGALLKPSSLVELWKPVRLNNGELGGPNELLNGQALGWPMAVRPDHPAAGAVGGTRSAVFYYPDDDLGIIVLTNLQGASPEYMMDRLAAAYVPDMDESTGFGLPPSIRRLRARLLEQGFDQARQIVSRLKAEDPEFSLAENDLNAWGYKLMEQQQPQQAVAVLKLTAELYPNSANAYDSLAEAFQNSGDRRLALENYSRSLALNPENQNARQRIADLEQSLGDRAN